MSSLIKLRLLHGTVYRTGTWTSFEDTNTLGWGIARIEQLESYLLQLAKDTPHDAVKDEINEVLNNPITLPSDRVR